MILKTEETNIRLNSTQNLLNRLNLKSNNKSPIKLESHIPVVLPTDSNEDLSIDDLINDVDSKIGLANAHKKSVQVLNKTLDELKHNIVNTDNPTQLAHIANSVSGVIKTIREDQRQRNLSNSSQGSIVIYKPVIMNENDFSFVSAKE